ncbi:hypothetical protein CBR_g23949 [Chara braunii]|uniref:Uncharacterized protein n=1 Tax=Chara braunii TaxID=69332 RepID=A0A388L5C5_CHABU|nr:hypothetical protein CBR_g23949 [Chara braunii]|eukprot:GBG77504.1 hypothetical protein CBR_g23949 [Chara braunii]
MLVDARAADEPLGDLRMKASSSGYRGLEAENGSDAKRSYTKTAADPSIEGGPTSGITDAETGQLTQNPTSSVSGQGPSSAEFSGAAVPNAMKNTKLQSARKDDKAGMHYIRNHGRQGATTASYPSMYRTHAQRSHASSGRNRNPPIHSPQRVLYTSSHNGGPASTTKSPGEIDTAQTEAYQELRFSTARTTGGNVEFENTYSPDQSQTERHDYSSPHDLFVGASFKPTRTAKPSTRRVRAAGAAGASRSQHLAKAFGNNIEIDELASWAKSPHKLFDLPVAPEREAWRQEVMDQISYLRGNPSVPRSPTGRGECSNRGCPSPYARLDPLLLDLVQGSSSSRKKIKLEIMKAKLRPVSPMRSRPFTMPGTDHAGVEWELFQETITAEETRHPEVDNGNFSKAKERTPVASGVQSNRWEIITVKETRHAEADRENFPKEKERTPVASGVQNNQQETVTTRHTEDDRESFPKAKERTPVASGEQTNQRQQQHIPEQPQCGHELLHSKEEKAMLVPPTLGPGQEGGPFSLEEQALATVSPKEVHTEQHKRHEAGVEKDKQNVSPIVQQGTTGQSTKKKKTKLKLDMSAVRSSLESEKEESDYNQKLDLHLQEAHHGATSAAANSLKKNSLKNAEPDNRSTVAVTTAAAASASGDIQRASSEVIRSAGHKDTSKSHAVTGRKSSKNSEDHLVPRPGEENYLVILQSDEELSRLETVRLAEYVHPASTHDVLPIANQKGPVRRSTQSGSMKSEGGQEHGLSSASTLHDEHHHRATENIGGSSAQKRAAVTLGASASGTSALYSEKEVPTRVGETQSYTPGSLSVSSKSSTEDRLAA